MSSAYVHNRHTGSFRKGTSAVGLEVDSRSRSIHLCWSCSCFPRITQGFHPSSTTPIVVYSRTLTHLDLSAPTTNTQQGELASTTLRFCQLFRCRKGSR